MKFLGNMLDGDEKPLCRSGLHSIYLLTGFFWFIAIAGLGWAVDFFLWSYFGIYIPAYEIDLPYLQFGFTPGQIGWLFTAGGAFILVSEIVSYLNTSLVVTSNRLLYKTGWIKVNVDSTDLVDILGAHVNQGWLGRFLGYGRLHLDCRFIDDVYIPYVKNPYGVVRAIEKIKDSRNHPQKQEGSIHPSHPVPSPPLATADGTSPNQTLIQITGSGPVYFVDKVPPDPRPPLKQLPKALGDTMLSAFRRKA